MCREFRSRLVRTKWMGVWKLAFRAKSRELLAGYPLEQLNDIALRHKYV